MDVVALPSTMRALVKRRPQESYCLEDIHTPQPVGEEVLIKVRQHSFPITLGWHRTPGLTPDQSPINSMYIGLFQFCNVGANGTKWYFATPTNLWIYADTAVGSSWVRLCNHTWLILVWSFQNRSREGWNQRESLKVRSHSVTLHWRHDDHDGVSNHQPHGCFLNRLFRHRSKKTSKLRGPVNSPHKGPVTRKIFPFDDVIMKYSVANVIKWPCLITLS